MRAHDLDRNRADGLPRFAADVAPGAREVSIPQLGEMIDRGSFLRSHLAGEFCQYQCLHIAWQILEPCHDGGLVFGWPLLLLSRLL